MGVSEVEAIRAWIVSRMTLVIDNDRGLYQEVTAAAVERLRADGITTKEEFRETSAGRGAYQPEELHVGIGCDVAEIVAARVASIEDDALRLIVEGVLDLSDRSQQVLLGEHYWPSDDDAFDDDEGEE